jgi:hypothetical protein
MLTYWPALRPFYGPSSNFQQANLYFDDLAIRNMPQIALDCRGSCVQGHLNAHSGRRPAAPRVSVKARAAELPLAAQHSTR